MQSQTTTTGGHGQPPRFVAGSRALFVIETPFQLLCAYEMIAEYKFDYTLVVRTTGVGRNDDQLREAVSVLKLRYIEASVRLGHHYGDTLKSIPKLLPPLLRRYDHAFLGSYISRFLMSLTRVIRARSVWLMDDGLATFIAQDQMAAKGVKPYNLATFFKVPALPGQEVVYHSFSRLGALTPTVYSEDALFIGQPTKASTAHSLFRAQLEEADYLQILEKCRKESTGRMVYIPHRVEDLAYVETLRQKFDLDIQYTSTCIELHFAQGGVMPRNVYTAISTAAFSLAAIFPQSTVSIFPSSLVDVVPHIRAVLAYAHQVPNMRVLELAEDHQPAG